MTKRNELLIAILVGTLVGGSLLYLLVNYICLAPAAAKDRNLAEKNDELEKLKKSIDANSRSRKTLETYATRTLGTDASTVSMQVQARLTAILAKVGLTNTSGNNLPPLTNISAKPLSGGSGVGQTLGWQISAKGRLDQVIDFLSYLDAEPYVHKIDKLSLKPNGPDVQVDLDFMTLVMVPMKTASLGPVSTMPATTQPALDLDEHRAHYAVIAARDVFRPYIQRDPPPPPPPADPPKPGDPPPPPPPPPPVNPEERMKVADLTIYNGQEVVGVYYTDTANRVERLKVGESLGGGTIVMIDRRDLPRRDNPNLNSPGRVILRIGDEYFAIDVETVVARKYPVPADRLPPELKRS